MSDIAYNAGLEIRYAIASSGIDPIQHIPEVDAIIERRLAEARRKAFIEAAEIAENMASKEDDEWRTDCGSTIETRLAGARSYSAGAVAAALRKEAEAQ
ncbi:hypothetical protein CN093_08620 [Sinorhizobium meliloti]|uniref:hypothetical protein n=1 Tax=Rhizobium meliloti TaxID=382 RepID=UPI000FD2705C|nr:hypothetical protein [Sinorhizobium meliloti]RVO41320.1 hypothetical protein CN093_08620 [Sinorhizobium meliloti]